MFSYFSDASSIPIFRAFAVMIVFAYFNLLALSILFFSVGLDIRLNLPVESGVKWFWPLIIIIPLFALFYYRLKRLGLHDLISENYSKETKQEKVNGGCIIIFYFVGSIMLFVLTLWLRQITRGN
jgi:hypothetical protein